MHQIFADLCTFESFCLEVIVCKVYFIIGIFLQITKVLVIWARY